MSSDPVQLLNAQPLRVATYNIHKGVQGIGLRRLEIHNLALAVETLDADIICLQEVRALNRREAMYFTRWPNQPQAHFLAPEGYDAVYHTNAVTKHGEHGNALLSRWPIITYQHEDMSDHRFEQRGLLHVELLAMGVSLHVIVVHFGLIPASRLRQLMQLRRYIARHVPSDAPLLVAGDFNESNRRISRMLRADELITYEGPRVLTYPSRFPVAQLDHVYARGLAPVSLTAPRGRVWKRMSDHLPLIAEFHLPLAPAAPQVVPVIRRRRRRA